MRYSWLVLILLVGCSGPVDYNEPKPLPDTPSVDKQRPVTDVPNYKVLTDGDMPLVTVAPPTKPLVDPKDIVERKRRLVPPPKSIAKFHVNELVRSEINDRTVMILRRWEHDGVWMYDIRTNNLQVAHDIHEYELRKSNGKILR